MRFAVFPVHVHKAGRERAKRARAATWERVRLAEEDRSMGRREAEGGRQNRDKIGVS